MTNSGQDLQFNIVCVQVQKRANSERKQGSSGLVEAKKAPIPNTVETGEEIPLRAGHKHSSKESFQLEGFLLNKRRLSLSGA